MINTVYTVVEVAKMLKVGSDDVIDAINEGALKCINVGTKQVITEELLNEFLNKPTNNQNEFNLETEMVVGKSKRVFYGNRGNSNKVANMLLKDYIPYFLNLRTTNASDRTLEGYFGIAKYFCRSKLEGGLGDYKLKELDDVKIHNFFKSMVRNYSQATMDKIYVVLKLALKYACKKGYIKEFIMEDIRKPISLKSTNKVNAYSEDELSTIMNAAESFPEMKPILVLLLHTGMRPGELRALEWKNFNDKNKTLCITNAITIKADNFVVGGRAKNREAVLGKTKTNASVRTIHLSDKAAQALNEWRRYIDTNTEFKNVKNSPYVFVSRYSKSFISESALNSRFRRFLEACGLDNKGYTFYRFRHTFCTKLIKHTDLRTVQDLMGDSTSNVVMKHYITVSESDKKNAIEDTFN